MMIRCVEAHAGYCSLTQIIQKIVTDRDRFYPYFSNVLALKGEGFTQCLGRFIIDVCLFEKFRGFFINSNNCNT